jgi:hypothetical protein
MGVDCVRSLPRKAALQEVVLPSPDSHASFKISPLHQASGAGTPGLLLSTENNVLEATPLGHLPTGGELGNLIHLYFESVHSTYATISPRRYVG